MRKTVRLYAPIIACVLSIYVGGWTIKSYFEARAYNRITGSAVSTFDAMFVELRVQETTTREK